MNKHLSWKQTLLAAFICMVINGVLGNILPSFISATLAVVTLATFVIGIIGAVKALSTRKG